MTDAPRFRYFSRRLQNRIWAQKTAARAWDTAHDDKVGGLVLQSRAKAQSFAARSNLFLVVLILTVVVFLGSFVVSPLIQRAAYEYYLRINNVENSAREVAENLTEQRSELEVEFQEVLGSLERAELSATRFDYFNHGVDSTVSWVDRIVYPSESSGPRLLVWDEQFGGAWGNFPINEETQAGVPWIGSYKLASTQAGSAIFLTGRGVYESARQATTDDLFNLFQSPRLILTSDALNAARNRGTNADIGVGDDTDLAPEFREAPTAFLERDGVNSYLLGDSAGSVFLVDGETVVQLVEGEFSPVNVIKRLQDGRIAAVSNQLLSILSPSGEAEEQRFLARETFGGSEWFKDVVAAQGGTYIAIGDEGQTLRLSLATGGTLPMTGATPRGPNGIAQLDRSRIAITASDGAIFTTADGGISWQKSAQANTSMGRIAALQDATGYLAYGQGGTIAVSRDLGDTWHIRQSVLSADQAAIITSVEDRTLAMLLTSTGVLYSVTDYRDADAALLAANPETPLSFAERVQSIEPEFVTQNDPSVVIVTPPTTMARQNPIVAPFEDILEAEVRLNAIEASTSQLRSAFSSGLETAFNYGPDDMQTRFELGLFLRDCTANTASATDTETIAACAEEFHKIGGLDGSQWWSDTVALLPGGVLLLFFLATLSRLYRYNLRLSVFHSSRADALEMVAQNFSGEDMKRFVEGSTALGADAVEFGSVSTPADKMAEQILAAINRAPNP